MVHIQYVLVILLSFSLTGENRLVTTCDTDCLTQAGVPCEILSSTTECPHRPASTSPGYPGLPGDVKVTHYMDDIIPQLNVTWVNPSTGLDFVEAYELQYWNYVDSTEEGGTKGPSGQFGLCVQYNMTRGIHPETHALFYHDCVRPTQHYFSLASLPQKEPQHDYVHRVVAMFKQDYEYTAHWRPALVVIHNDSCDNTVGLELDLAPANFTFEHYRVALRYADGRTNDANVTDFKVEPGENKHFVEFHHVPSGHYIIKIYPEPDDRGHLCSCPNCGAGGCFSSQTGAFIMDDQHHKCRQDSPVSSPLPLPSQPVGQDISLMIALSVLCLFLLLLFVVIFVAFFRRKLKYTESTKQDDGPSALEEFNPSLFPPQDASRFEGRYDIDSINDRQSYLYRGGTQTHKDERGKDTNSSPNSTKSDAMVQLHTTVRPMEMTNMTSIDDTIPVNHSVSELNYGYPNMDMAVPGAHQVSRQSSPSLFDESDRRALDDIGLVPPLELSAVHERGASILGSTGPDSSEIHQYHVIPLDNITPESGMRTTSQNGNERWKENQFTYNSFPTPIPTGKKKQCTKLEENEVEV